LGSLTKKVITSWNGSHLGQARVIRTITTFFSFSGFLYHCGLFSCSSSLQDKVAALGSAIHNILGSSLSMNHVLLFKN